MRRAATLLVAGWLGAALLTAAVVAPAAFAVLPTRALAGALVGRILPVLFLSGAVLALAEWWAARRGDRHGVLIRVAPVIWFVAMIAAQFGVTPRIRSVRESAGPPIETLPQDDQRRVTFGRLHGISVGLLGVGMVGALVGVAAGSRTERQSQG